MQRLGHIVCVSGGIEPPRRQGRQEGAEGLNRQDAEGAKAGAWAGFGASPWLCLGPPLSGMAGQALRHSIRAGASVIACRSTSPAIPDPGQERRRADPDPGSGGGLVRIGGPGNLASFDIALRGDRPANPDDGAPSHDPMPSSPACLPELRLGDPGVLAVQPSGSERSNHPPYPRPQDGHVEVDQQTQRSLHGTQIRDQLSRMDRKKLRDCLQLNDQTVGDEQIEARLPDRVRLVLDCDRNLPFEGQVQPGELHTERLLIDGFGETRAKHTMDLDRRAYDRVGCGVDFLVRFNQVGAHLPSSDESSRSFHLSCPGMGGAANLSIERTMGPRSIGRASRPPFADARITDEWRSQCVKQ
jgi:hypothetical protein